MFITIAMNLKSIQVADLAVVHICPVVILSYDGCVQTGGMHRPVIISVGKHKGNFRTDPDKSWKFVFSYLKRGKSLEKETDSSNQTLLKVVESVLLMMCVSYITVLRE